jgi:hypothetical protein
MTANERQARVASSPIEALVEVDAWLAVIVPNYTRARATLLDLQPGLSGRPVGTGDPGGGHGGFTSAGERASSSVVERALGLGGDGDGVGSDPIERRALDQLERLPSIVVVEAWGIAQPIVPIPVPGDARPSRRLVFARWCVRQVLAADRTGPKVSLYRSDVNRLHADTHQLHTVVAAWSNMAHRATLVEQTLAGDLAVDELDDGCVSHRRVNEYEERSDRYPTKRLCRRCGDFDAAQGFLPSPEILRAWRDGRRLTSDMVDRARPDVKRKRKRKGKR